MSKFKLFGKKMREQNNGIQILETEYREKPEVCKECKQKPKAQASSRCVDCSTKYRVQKFESDRLKERVEEATN